MKNLYSLALLFITTILIVGCKKTDGNVNVFYVDVVDDYYGNNYGSTFNVDIDVDNADDITFETQRIVDEYYDDTLFYYVTTVNSSITLKGEQNKMQFAATDDCIDLYYNSSTISADLNFEDEATLANDYAISCNPTSGGKRYLGFRINKNNKWHYGWMQISYNLNSQNNNYNNNVTIRIADWGYHLKDGKNILTGQQE